MKYCTHCGKELLDEAIICPSCGCKVGKLKTSNKGLETATKVLLILSAASFSSILFIVFFNPFSLLFLLPLAYIIPMTVHYFKTKEKGEDVSVGFKICTLIFVNLIAGILMLIDNDD